MGRTFGETKNCKGCRYWSEMIAKLEAGIVVAMCINSESLEKGNYKSGWSKCDSWKSGQYGAIDTPGMSLNEDYEYDDQVEEVTNNEKN